MKFTIVQVIIIYTLLKLCELFFIIARDIKVLPNSLIIQNENYSQKILKLSICKIDETMIKIAFFSMFYKNSFFVLQTVLL